MGLKRVVLLTLCSFLFLATSGAYASVGNGPNSTLVKTYLLAGKGQTISSAPFGVDSKIEDIKKSWGEPDTELYGLMLGYQEKNVILLTMARDETVKDYVTAISPLEDELKGIPLTTLVRDLGDPTHKEVIDEDTMVVCYDTKGYHLQFVLNRDQETNTYVESGYMVAREFMVQT